MNDEQIKTLQAMGERLAHMLANAPISDEEKEAWAALVPHMEFEQMETFAQYLASKLEAAAQEELKDLTQEIQKAQEEYELAIAAAQQTAFSDLDAIKAELA